MLKNITTLFHKKKRNIEDEIVLKSKIDEILTEFMKEDIFNGTNLDFRLSYTVNNGLIKIETGNKLIAQEIALRIKTLEDRLKKNGVVFRKVLV